MYFYSASSYSHLINSCLHLPSETSVRRWVSELDIKRRFNNSIFNKLNKYLMSLQEDERICTLKLDEMCIKSMEEY